MITSITFSSAPLRKKPRAGDRKVDRRGVAWVRCRAQVRGLDGRLCDLSNNGRPVYEWRRA